jgi:C-terminal processing protease CtpA/Prc
LASAVATGVSKTDVKLLAAVMQLVQQDYVHPIDTDKLTADALKGMLSRLDPHSCYMMEPEFRESVEDMDGKFGGVGLKITDHNRVPTVISPIDGTPAAHAGVQPGDAIVAVDGQSTRGADLMEAIRKIRGNSGTTVKLTVVRGDKPPFEIPLTRQIIAVHSVKSKLEPDRIGYIRISKFGQGTPNELRQAISTLKRDAGGKPAGLVLDLRNDPGGLLSSAVDVSGDFLNALRLTTALYDTPSGRSIQDDGITPDIVVQAPKDEQVANSLVWREGQLHGAFANPGPLTKSKDGPNNGHVSVETASPPIKPQLIGTSRDAQLTAALNLLRPRTPNSAAVGASAS